MHNFPCNTCHLSSFVLKFENPLVVISPVTCLSVWSPPWPLTPTPGRLVLCQIVKSWAGVAASDHRVTAVAESPLQDQTKHPSERFTPRWRHSTSVLTWTKLCSDQKNNLRCSIMSLYCEGLFNTNTVLRDKAVQRAGYTWQHLGLLVFFLFPHQNKLCGLSESTKLVSQSGRSVSYSKYLTDLIHGG